MRGNDRGDPARDSLVEMDGIQRGSLVGALADRRRGCLLGGAVGLVRGAA